MGNEPTHEVVPEGVKVGPVEHLPELSAEDQKRADAIAAAVKARLAEADLSKTIPSTRPKFGPAPTAESHQAELATITKKGYLPVPINTHTLEGEETVKSINVNSFPRGDIDNFSVWRWAMADQRAHYTVEGSSAYAKYAPWESMYYDAARKVVVVDPITKAQGDMVSGLIPGRAA